MTEEEAKTKWCPHTRALSHTLASTSETNTYEGGYSYNRSPDDGEGYIPRGCRCIASACMAWRWSDEIRLNEDNLYVTDFSTTHGYCGLAGKP